jgi:flagellar hook assembly protein FlgD
LPARVQGAQRASAASVNRTLVVFIVVALLALSVQLAWGSQLTRAGADTAAPKAVIITGPSSERTKVNLSEAEHLAHQAEAAGMHVYRVFHPNATWRHVLDVIQGANLVVYFGHGNGWPSPYSPYQEDSKDGFTLDPSDGASAYSAEFYGANKIRDKVQLAPNAVVLLMHLCYAAGNGEPWMGPDFDKSLATKRVDNYASGFLDVGARAVFAFGSEQQLDFPNALANGNKTMDQIFMTSTSDARQYNNGFNGWDDYYRDSQRTPWARLHLDPNPHEGHYRAVSGDLGMTAARWRGQDALPDTKPPALTIRGALDHGRMVAGDAADPATFSPDGDGRSDRLIIDRRLSEAAVIDVEVRDASDSVVDTFRQSSGAGHGQTGWNGHDAAGHAVPDGIYRLILTPTDKAGNVGESRKVTARVQTTLGWVHASRGSIDVADGDKLAASTQLSARLGTAARVTWVIRDSHGRVVRTLFQDKRHAAGPIDWLWQGTNQRGALVADGWYTSEIAATTGAGTMLDTSRLYVGAYRIELGDGTPKRGSQLHITVHSTEQLKAPPVLRITRPGIKPSIIHTRRVGPDTFSVTVHITHQGKAGAFRIQAVGTDVAGGHQAGTRTVHIS